jgi:hypothetical protein
MMRRWGFQSTHLLSAGLFTGLALAGVCLPRPAAAQTVYMDEGGPGGFDAVLPSDVMSSVRSTGLRPVSRPVLRGRRYVLHAIDTDGVPVRVVVNARTGQVMNVRAVGPDGGPPRWAERHMGPGGLPQRADRSPPNRSYIDPETGERIYEEHVYREGERDYRAPQNTPDSRGPHPNATAKPPASKKAEKVKLPPRKTAARTPEKDVTKDVRKDAPDSAKATTTQQPADTAHSDKPVTEETATKTSEPTVIEPNEAGKTPEAKTVETKPDVKPSERQASQPNPDATEHQAPSHAEAIKNADKTVDKNAISAKAGDFNATDTKADDTKADGTKAADGKSASKIDRALAERVNAQVIAKAKAEAKAQTEAKAGAKSGPKAGSDNSAANSKHKTDHETDGSASNGNAFPPVQDLE